MNDKNKSVMSPKEGMMQIYEKIVFVQAPLVLKMDKSCQSQGFVPDASREVLK
jgi:hypothetical protein